MVLDSVPSRDVHAAELRKQSRGWPLLRRHGLSLGSWCEPATTRELGRPETGPSIFSTAADIFRTLALARFLQVPSRVRLPPVEPLELRDLIDLDLQGPALSAEEPVNA